MTYSTFMKSLKEIRVKLYKMLLRMTFPHKLVKPGEIWYNKGFKDYFKVLSVSYSAYDEYVVRVHNLQGQFEGYHEISVFLTHYEPCKNKAIKVLYGN